MEDALARLKAAGIEIVTRQFDAKIAAVETAIAPARPLSLQDQRAGRSRWPLNTYRERDASEAQPRHARSARRGRGDDARRLPAGARASASGRARSMPGSRASATPASALSAPAAAPLGLGSTGDPVCTVHASLLGIPAMSLPVLRDEDLPLGLQVTGFAHGDAATFAAAAWIQALFR